MSKDQVIILIIYTAPLIAMVVYFYLKNKKLEQRIKCLEPAIVIKPIKHEHLRKEVIQTKEQPKKSMALDATKRKSLQPSNQNIIPKGFKELQRNIDGEVIAFLEERMPIAFDYKFFGSSLIVHGMPAVMGLANKLHMMSVDENNNATIDGKEVVLHPDVVEAIREMARSK